MWVDWWACLKIRRALDANAPPLHSSAYQSAGVAGVCGQCGAKYLAVGEAVILLHPPLTSVGVSIAMVKGVSAK